MASKVTVELKVKLIINVEEGEDINELLSDMEYDFDSRPDGAENRIVDTEILEQEVVNSK